MNQQEADPRTNLATDRTDMARYRTQLALDRTTLAWIRTALTMATFGFGVVGFFRALREKNPTPETAQLHHSAIQFGISLVVLGIVVTVLAGMSQWLELRKIRRQEVPIVSQWTLSITVALLFAIMGLVAVWHFLPVW